MESIRFLHMVRYGGINMFISLCKKIKQQIGETVSFTFYLLYAIVSLYFAFRCITNPFGNSGAIPCWNTQCLIVFYKYHKDFQEYCIHAGEYI
mgnify:CR=1 FL=1